MFSQPIPFGKYYLLERINVGGMAEVFKAKTFGVEGFERLLAVKRILPNIAEDNEFIEMFIDEAKIAVELHHANIAQIYDLGKVDAAYFIALEYIHGKDLRAIFDRTRKLGEALPIPMACYAIMKVCEGIDYAHNKRDDTGREMNLVHRDISPQNILVSYEGEVKIIDFGIAKAANKASKTQAGILKGKFGYMSPEQVKGLPLDRRSDIFSVGIVLYELLTGERLFLGESDFSTLEKVRNVEIMPPTLHNPKIPEELEAIVFKALAKNVEERYENAIDLQDDIQRFLYSAGSFFSRKDLSQYMKRAFSEELSRENAQIEAYRHIQPPAHVVETAYNQSSNGFHSRASDNSQSLAEAFVAAAHLPQATSKPESFPNPGSPQHPNPNISSAQIASPYEEAQAVPTYRNTPPPSEIAQANPATPNPYTELPEATTPFSSGFVNMPVHEVSTGNTQVLRDSDILFEDDINYASYTNQAPPQQPQEPLTTHPENLYRQEGFSSETHPPPPIIHSHPISSYPPPNQEEYTSSDTIPPLVSLQQHTEKTHTKKLLLVLGLLGAFLLIVVLIYFLFVGNAKGTLVIVTTPANATVSIDGAPIKSTSSPHSALLDVGTHRITATHKHYNSLEKSVRIEEGLSVKLELLLPSKDENSATSADRGSIYIDSTPEGAEIIIDGILHPEKTPAVVDSLVAGPHSIKVTPRDPVLNPFFLPSVIVKAGKTIPVKAKFDLQKGNLSITSDPSGARASIYLVQEKQILHRGTTPLTVSDLPLRETIEIVVEKRGFPKTSKKIVLEDTETLSLPIQLSSKKSGNDSRQNDQASRKNSLGKLNNNTKSPTKNTVATGKTGFLTIGSSPSCECIVNGVSKGFTPCMSIEVKSGKQSVRLKNKNFGIDQSFSVQVKPGERKRFNKKFSISEKP